LPLNIFPQRPRRHPPSTLFPYTTLFRSRSGEISIASGGCGIALNQRAMRRTLPLRYIPRRNVAVIAKDSPRPIDFQAIMARKSKIGRAHVALVLLPLPPSPDLRPTRRIDHCGTANSSCHTVYSRLGLFL